MSLIIHKTKPWERHVSLQYHHIDISTESMSRSYGDSGTYRTSNNIPASTPSEGSKADDYNLTTFQEIRRETRRDLNVLEEIFLRTRSGWSEHTATALNFPGTYDDYTESTYETVDGYTQVIDYAAGITYRTDFENESITETSATFNVNGAANNESRFDSTFETIETDLSESKTSERFLALDIQSRFLFSNEETNYLLADFPDTRHLTREAMGLTASTREEEYAQYTATSVAATAADGVFQLELRQCWRTRDSFDSGSIFHELHQSEFGLNLLTFSAMWSELADGAEVELPARKIVIEGVEITGDAVEIETVTFRVPAYQLSVHELNDLGKWTLVGATFPEEIMTDLGYGWSVLETVTDTAFVYQIPALERQGAHASVLKMINVIGHDTVAATYLIPRKSALDYATSSSGADVTNDSATYSYTSQSPHTPPDPPNPIWTYEGGTASYDDTATSFARVYTGSYTQEYIIEGIGAGEVTPFNAFLVQEIRTPGYVPFGIASEDVLYHTYSSREITATFDTEVPTSLLFDMPAPVLTGEVFEGWRKLDLCPRAYEAVVTKDDFTYVAATLAISYPFTAGEEERTLTRIVQVKQRWEYPESEDETYFTVATLHQNARDSDGFTSARALEYVLKEPIPKQDQTGHTIGTFDRGWEIVGPNKDATVFFGRCLLHYTTISNGVESYRTIVAQRDSSFTVSKGLSIAIRIEPLWQALGSGTIGSNYNNLMTRGSQYLNF